MSQTPVKQLQEWALAEASDASLILAALESVSSLDGYAQLEPQSKIIVSGYYYSGSGALLDFLADHAGVLKWPEAVETRFINLPWGLNSLRASIGTHGHLRAVDLLRLYLHLIGQIPRAGSWTDEQLHLVKVANRTSRALLNGHCGHVYKECIARFIGFMLPRIGSTVEGAATTLSLFFEDYNARLKQENDATIVAYDRPLPPQRLERLSLTGALPLYAAVHRDPRSQFADICRSRTAKGQKVMTAKAFVKMYRDRRVQALTSAREASTFPVAGLFLSFEDLVTSPGTRAAVREYFGLHEASYQPAKLLTEVSAANIDLYKSSPDPAAVDEVASELPEYLWPAGAWSGSFVAAGGELTALSRTETVLEEA